MSDTSTLLAGLRTKGTGLYAQDVTSLPPAIATPEPAPSKPRGVPNRYGGLCSICGIWVVDGEGILDKKVQGTWKVRHIEGQCPQRAEVPEAMTKPALRVNKYPKGCDLCGRTVAAEQGWLQRADDGSGWIVTHNGSCPSEFPFPEGRYAVENDEGDLRFYHCADDGEVYVMASDIEHLLARSAADAVIAKIAVDPLAASKRYGIEFERCGVCNRGLTSEWRLVGIGPVCSGKGF